MNAFFSGLCAKAGCRQLMEAHQVAHMHKREQGLTHVEEEEGTEGGTAFVLFQAGGIEGKRKSALPRASLTSFVLLRMRM